MKWNFDLRPEAALQFFRSKGLKASFSWQDMWADEHDTAFTVAKMMDMDLLRDVKEHVDRALASGTTFQDFRKSLEPELVKRGWWGRAAMNDPLTGETRNVQLGSVRRLQTIFRTNMQSAYAAGDWEQILDTADSAPFLMYDAIDDNRTRPQHHAWDGTTLRFDDPWWQTHRPLNGYNCRCSTIQLSDADLKASGKTVSSKAPAVTTREYVNQRSGEISEIPDGIDPGFDYNPGSTSQRVRALELFGQKVAGVPADIGAAAFAALAAEKPSVVRAIDDGFALWAERAVAQKLSSRTQYVVGALAPDDVVYLKTQGIAPVSAEIAVDDRLVVGRKAQRHAEAGDALTMEELKRVPVAVRAPEAVLYDTANRTLLYVTSSSDNRSAKIVVRPNVVTKKPKRTLNSVQSAFKVARTKLGEQQFVVVRGSLQ